MFETLRVIRFSFRNGGFFEFRWMDNLTLDSLSTKAQIERIRNTRQAKHFLRIKSRSKYSETGSKVSFVQWKDKGTRQEGLETFTDLQQLHHPVTPYSRLSHHDRSVLSLLNPHRPLISHASTSASMSGTYTPSSSLPSSAVDYPELEKTGAGEGQSATLAKLKTL